MKKYNLWDIGKKGIIAGMLLTSLLFGGREARAENIYQTARLEEKILDEERPKQIIVEEERERKIIVEKEREKNTIDLISNYYWEKNQKSVDYLTSQIRFYRDFKYLIVEPNTLKLDRSRISEVNDVIKDIKNRKINSYQNFVNQTNNFSENQKLIFLSAIGDLSSGLWEESDGKVFPQEDFFSKIQLYLNSGQKENIGVCRHIHSNLEQLANDIGIRAAAVSGERNGNGHVYAIMKTENGSAIIDYGELITANTKNIEKMLGIYQKYRGNTEFEHKFFEDSKFKYTLITKDGEHFLDFIDYDRTSESFKNLLLSGVEKGNDLKIIFEGGNYLNSAEINFLGFFIKTGEIEGDSSSPLKNIKLSQFGYKRKFNLFDLLNIDSNFSLIRGKIEQDYELEDNTLKGCNFDLGISLDREEGFKAGLRVVGGGSGIIKNIKLKKEFLNENFLISYIKALGGVSYKIKTESIEMEPYVIIQVAQLPKDIGTWEHEIRFSESRIGTSLDFKLSKNLNLSVEPYYIKRIWEKEFGADIEYKKEDISMKIGGYKTNSDYDFCPDKTGFNVELHKDFGKWRLWSNYEKENLDYDGEITKERKFKIGASLRF